MKISIITVVYNNKLTIKDAISSVFEQTFENIEHIIIDGGSTDGTKEILEEEYSKYKVLVSEPDNGIYDAMNKGISLATGDVIGILNSDDSITDFHRCNKVEAEDVCELARTIERSIGSVVPKITWLQ